MLSKVKHWLPILSRLLGGQALVQLINLVCALLLLRQLPLSEYALFVGANLFISLGSIGSDLNLSTAFTTFGARLVGDKAALSSLFTSVFYLRRRLYIVVAIVIMVAAPFVFGGHAWNIVNMAFVLVIVLITVWFQQSVALRNQVLYIHHDVPGVFLSGLSGAISRLTFTYLLCYLWPYASIALIANLAAVLIVVCVTRKRSKIYVIENALHDKVDDKNLKQFIYPLIPSAIYFAFQGQISFLLIGIYGDTNSMAGVGALSRLSQIFLLLGVLNGFLFQPMFAREKNRNQLLKKISVIALLLIAGFMVVLTSAYVAPEIWLLLLGEKYKSLQREVPIALAGAVISYMAGYVYTILAARAFTKYQSWNIFVTILSQALFVASVGVSTTYNLLMFNVITSAATFLVQIILMLLMFRAWRSSK